MLSDVSEKRATREKLSAPFARKDVKNAKPCLPDRVRDNASRRFNFYSSSGHVDEFPTNFHRFPITKNSKDSQHREITLTNRTFETNTTGNKSREFVDGSISFTWKIVRSSGLDRRKAKNRATLRRC